MEKPILVEYLGLQYPSPTSKKRISFGIYKCFCGKLFRCASNDINGGHTKSCGCYKKEKFHKLIYRHGLREDRLYPVWTGMKDRCYRENAPQYKDWGGRSIIVCPEWIHDFKVFYDWAMSHGYKEGLWIHRINNDGNYEPSNCKFSDLPEQMQDTRLLRSTNNSGYRCVWFHKKTNKWASTIRWNRKRYYLGVFNTPELAAQAYNNFVIEHKTAHPLNIIPE